MATSMKQEPLNVKIDKRIARWVKSNRNANRSKKLAEAKVTESNSNRSKKLAENQLMHV